MRKLSNNPTEQSNEGLLNRIASIRKSLLSLLGIFLVTFVASCGDDELPDCPEGQVPVGKIDSDGDLTTVCDEVNDKIQECDGFPMQVIINGQKTTICADFSLQDCEGKIVVVDHGNGNKQAICEIPPDNKNSETSGSGSNQTQSVLHSTHTESQPSGDTVEDSEQVETEEEDREESENSDDYFIEIIDDDQPSQDSGTPVIGDGGQESEEEDASVPNEPHETPDAGQTEPPDDIDGGQTELPEEPPATPEDDAGTPDTQDGGQSFPDAGQEPEIDAGSQCTGPQTIENVVWDEESSCNEVCTNHAPNCSCKEAIDLITGQKIGPDEEASTGVAQCECTECE